MGDAVEEGDDKKPWSVTCGWILKMLLVSHFFGLYKITTEQACFNISSADMCHTVICVALRAAAEMMAQ